MTAHSTPDTFRQLQMTIGNLQQHKKINEAQIQAMQATIDELTKNGINFRTLGIMQSGNVTEQNAEIQRLKVEVDGLKKQIAADQQVKEQEFIEFHAKASTERLGLLEEINRLTKKLNDAKISLQEEEEDKKYIIGILTPADGDDEKIEEDPECITQAAQALNAASS